eukprot:39174_1
MSRLIWISVALLFLLRFTIGRSCLKVDKLETFTGTCHLCIESKKVKLEAGGVSHCYRRTNSHCRDETGLSPPGPESRPCTGTRQKITCACPAVTIGSSGDRYSRLGSKGKMKPKRKPKRTRKTGGSKGKRKPKRTGEEWKPLAAVGKTTTIPKGKSRSTGKTTGRSKGKMMPERKPKRRHGYYEPEWVDVGAVGKKTTIPKAKSRSTRETTGRSKGKSRSKRKPKKSKGKEEKPSTAAEFEQCVIDNMG